VGRPGIVAHVEVAPSLRTLLRAAASLREPSHSLEPIAAGGRQARNYHGNDQRGSINGIFYELLHDTPRFLKAPVKEKANSGRLVHHHLTF
jgi:hypothetical protein